jgi:hypothetical protein
MNKVPAIARTDAFYVNVFLRGYFEDRATVSEMHDAITNLERSAVAIVNLLSCHGVLVVIQLGLAGILINEGKGAETGNVFNACPASHHNLNLSPALGHDCGYTLV